MLEGNSNIVASEEVSADTFATSHGGTMLPDNTSEMRSRDGNSMIQMGNSPSKMPHAHKIS